MGDERRTVEEDRARLAEEMEDEFEIDSESEGDLDSVMQEALEAVEKASHGLRLKEVADEEPETSTNRVQANSDDDILRLEQEIADLRDRSARTLADFDNYRKRIEREREEDRRYAAFDIMREFLTVVDNLERALASESANDDLKTGVELIFKQMMDLMKKVGVGRIEALGEEFDPRFHEAVSRHEDSSIEVPTVTGELQPGYLMHGRLLRPAVVRVAMPPESQTDSDA